MNFCFDRFEISLQNILKDDPLQPGMDDLPLLSENIYGEANQLLLLPRTMLTLTLHCPPELLPYIQHSV